MKTLIIMMMITFADLSAHEMTNFKLLYTGIGERTVKTHRGLEKIQVLKSFKIDAKVFNSLRECQGYLSFPGVILLLSKRTFEVVDIVRFDYTGEVPEGVFGFPEHSFKFSCEKS